jgi:hypothetical protein
VRVYNLYINHTEKFCISTQKGAYTEPLQLDIVRLLSKKTGRDRKMKKPDHIPSDFDSFLLIKFCKCKQWQDQFIGGKFYMNTVGFLQQYFECGNNKQFDFYEGTQVYLRTTGETHWELLPDNKGEYWYVEKPGMPPDNRFITDAALGRKVESEKKLFCMYTLWGNSKKKVFMKIEPSIIKDFGEYAVVAIDTPLFLKRVQEEADSTRDQMNNAPIYDFVNYLHRESLSAITPLGIYRKIQEDSVHQSEFRICFDMKNIEGPYKEFQIQNSDICIPFQTEKLINMLSLGVTGLKFGRL